MKLGSTSINAAYLGSTAVNKIYLGTTKVFPSAPLVTADGFSSGVQPGRMGISVPDSELSSNLTSFVTASETLGAKWMRFDMRAGNLKPSNGAYSFGGTDTVVNALTAAGINIVPILMAGGTSAWVDNTFDTAGERTSFADYCAGVVDHYPEITYWELLNEPNLASTTTLAANYTELMKVVYPAIKEANPNAQLIVGSFASIETTGSGHQAVSSFVDTIYANGGGPFLDAFSQHSYGPDLLWDNEASWHARQRIAEIRTRMVSNGHSDKLIWITETGGATEGSTGTFYTDPDDISIWMRQMYDDLASRDYMGPILWYSIQDRQAVGATTNAEDYFGMRRSNGTTLKASWPQYIEIVGEETELVVDEDTGVQIFRGSRLFQSFGNPTRSLLSYALVSPPTGVTINSTTGVVSVNTATAAEQSGTTITIQASRDGETANATFDLTVNAAPTYSPIDEPTLQAWYDFSDEATLKQTSAGTGDVTADTNPIGYASDKSGQARHLIQPTAANKPLYRSTGGEEFASFAGASVATLAKQPTPALGRNVGVLTLAFVARLNATPTSTLNAVFLSNANFNSQGRASVRINTNLSMEAGGRRLDSNGFATFGPRTVTVGAKFIYIANFNYAAGQGTTHYNGLTTGPVSFQTSGNTSDTEALAFCLGGHPGDTVANDLDIFEVVLTGSMDIDALEAYLAAKHGITL